MGMGMRMGRRMGMGRGMERGMGVGKGMGTGMEPCVGGGSQTPSLGKADSLPHAGFQKALP